MHGSSTEPFWPTGGKQLDMKFEIGTDGTCHVRGLDPDNNNHLVFVGDLRTAQQERFIEAVEAGRSGTLMTAANENTAATYRVALTAPAMIGEAPAAATSLDDNAVVISGGDPGGDGTKAVVISGGDPGGDGTK